MESATTLHDQVKCDLWRWINEFISVPNDFYKKKFAPCPYAKSAVLDGQVDVVAWESGSPRDFIRDQAMAMRDERPLTGVTTRCMGFPPRMLRAWGLVDYVDALNLELVADNVFLNAGVAKDTISRFPGSQGEPYFIVIANTLDGVLKGSEALQRTAFYKNWPAEQFRTVVERRAWFAERYGCPHAAGEQAKGVAGKKAG